MMETMDPVEYIPRIRRQYAELGYPPFRWVTNPQPPPWQPVRAVPTRARLAIVASGGIYLAGQTAFHHKDDTSIRAISSGSRVADLRVTHFAYDMTDARADPNVVFPIETARRLAAEGAIGALTDHFYTFMGGIYSARRVREELAPQITERLLAERADLALLVPV